MRNDSINGLSNTATTGGITNLNVDSLPYQRFTGTNTQTIVLPVVTTLSTGWKVDFINDSTGALTINSSGNNLVTIVGANSRITLNCTSTATDTTAAPWSYSSVSSGTYTIFESLTGALNGTNVTFTTSKTPINSTVVVILNGVIQTISADYSVSGSTVTFTVAPISIDILTCFYSVSYIGLTGIAENVANKSTSVITDQTSDIKYPSVKSVYDWGTGAFAPKQGDLMLSTATAAGTTYLTVSSLPYQRFTGTTTQTITLPVVTTLTVGWNVEIINDSTGILTIQSSGGNLVATVAAGDRASLSCTAISADTTAAPWTIIKFIQSTPSVSGVPAGTIIAFAGSSVPTGYLQCATTVTNVSRTTYAALFTAIGTAWGAGDGSTTFGIPYFATGYTPVQDSSGISTVGAVIAHTHTIARGTSLGTTVVVAGSGTAAAITTSSTGGAANLAAGMGVKFCVKY